MLIGHVIGNQPLQQVGQIVLHQTRFKFERGHRRGGTVDENVQQAVPLLAAHVLCEFGREVDDLAVAFGFNVDDESSHQGYNQSMVARIAQVNIPLLAPMLMVMLTVANICSAGADAPLGKYAAQLQTECRQLIADAVERPYGIAWGDAPAVGKGTAARPVSMEPGNSPAAGVVLLWAGELLHDASLTNAAKKSAAAAMAAQAPSGQIAALAMFGTTADPKTDDTPLPDRASTTAGMGLMLAVLDPQLNRDQPLLDSVDRAARWMRKQHGNGSWLRADGTKRFIRLDDADFRDSTFALLLEHEVLDRPDSRQAVERAVSQAISLQLNGMTEFLPGARLWGARYETSNEPVPDGDRPKDTADLLATRYMTQTLLGVAVCWSHRSTVAELDRTAGRINPLRRTDGKWKRYEAVGASTPVEAPLGDFGLPPLLASIKSIKNLGRDRYKQLMTQGWPPKRQLIATVVGLTDDPFTLDWPVAASEVDAYVKAHSADWQALESGIPQQLPARVRRLWILLNRAKLEAMAG